MYYKIPAKPGWVTIDGQSVWVDSQTEARFLQYLESKGFSGRWRRTEKGISVGRDNYTPDVELSVQFNGRTHRAIVEVKPTISAFNPYISRRMRGISKHYFSELFLLFVDDAHMWYRIDKRTGELTAFDEPTPGDIPIKRLYKPLIKQGPRIYSHSYVQRFRPFLKLWGLFADALELLIITPLKPRRTRAKRRSSAYRRRRRGRNPII